MLVHEELQNRARLTLECIAMLVPGLYDAAERDDRVGALHAYATISRLVDELQALSAKDRELAGSRMRATANLNENVIRLQTSCRVLAGLEPAGHSNSQHRSWAHEAVAALRGPFGFDVR